ncbi:hypothetical protein J6590_040099 [Homalodisca vitripennis]|nr:hypothetical protein J6590_040099 [Homalodisca vitripennis]
MSESDSDDQLEPRRKKGKVNKHLHNKGEEFVTDKGKLVEKKTCGPDCSCKKLCMAEFSDEHKQCIITNLYKGQPKNEKDIYLMGLIDRVEVARYRPVSGSSKQNTSSYKYFAMKDNTRVPVCRKAFINLHAITSKALYRLTQLKEANNTPEDRRGKHDKRVNAKSAEITGLIHSHITSFPTKISHYTTTTQTYLDAHLTVKYEFYLKFFRDIFSYRFGRPQIDACSTCEDLNTKIKSTVLCDTAKRAAVGELIAHKSRGKKFYRKLEEIKDDSCGGQNRNHSMTRFLLALTMTGRFKTIHQYYPVRGHSFMPCDRTFEFSRLKSIFLSFAMQRRNSPPMKWLQYRMKISRTLRPGGLYFSKKTPGSVQNVSDKFSLSKYRYIIYSYNSQEKGYVQTYEYIQGIVSATFRLAKTGEVSLPSAKAYGGPVPIMKKKLNDISKVTHYIPKQYRGFYEERLAWPTGNNSDNEED